MDNETEQVDWAAMDGDDWDDEEQAGHMDGLATLDEDGPYGFATPRRGDGTMRQVKRQHYRTPRVVIDILYPMPF